MLRLLVTSHTVLIRPAADRLAAPVCAVLRAPPMRTALSIKAEPWSDVDGRGIYLHASTAGHIYGPIGSAGMELKVCDADGRNAHDCGAGIKPRAVVSGTILVQPSFRRQGIARHLLMELESQARWWGQTELLLPVDANNDPAVALYSSMGYARTRGTRDCRSGEVCMRRSLYSPTLHNLQSMMPRFTTITLG